MEKIFIETSVFIRYFTRDDAKRYQESTRIIELSEEGKFKPYVSNIVLSEIIYVLMKIYNFPKIKVLKAIEDICNMRNMVIVETTDSSLALKYFRDFSIKYGDCLIATQIPEGTKVITYDSDFAKIPHLSVFSPAGVGHTVK